jgi:hypothetical protein
MYYAAIFAKESKGQCAAFRRTAMCGASAVQRRGMKGNHIPGLSGVSDDVMFVTVCVYIRERRQVAGMIRRHVKDRERRIAGIKT